MPNHRLGLTRHEWAERVRRLWAGVIQPRDARMNILAEMTRAMNAATLPLTGAPMAAAI